VVHLRAHLGILRNDFLHKLLCYRQSSLKRAVLSHSVWRRFRRWLAFRVRDTLLLLRSCSVRLQVYGVGGHILL